MQIRSQNVDVYNLTLHSHLYRILTPSGSNFLDFGPVIINSPTIRTIHFENLTVHPLSLELAASQPEDVELFVKVEDATSSLPGQRNGITNPKYTPETGTGNGGGELKERFMESLREVGTKVESGGSAGFGKGKAKTREKSVARGEEEGKKVNVAIAVATALKRGGRGRPVTVSSHKTSKLVRADEW